MRDTVANDYSPLSQTIVKDKSVTLIGMWKKNKRETSDQVLNTMPTFQPKIPDTD